MTLKFLDRKDRTDCEEDSLRDPLESAFGGGVASLDHDCGCEMELFPH